MTISLDFIARKAKEYYPEVQAFFAHNILINEVLLLDHQQSSFKPNVLYIGKASHFPKSFPPDTTINFLCMADCYIPKKHKNNKHLNLLILSRNNSIANVFNKIYGLFQKKIKISESKERLMNCLFESNSLQRLADTAYELMGNPVAIMVEGFKALACTNVEVNNKEWNHFVESHYCGQNAVHFHKTSAEMQRCLMSRKPTICHDPYYVDMYISNVFIHNRLVATIGLHEHCKNFDEHDPEILSVMSQIVSLELQKSKYNFINKARSFEFLFNDLLQEKVISDQEINDRLKYINLHLKKYLYVFTIDLSMQNNNTLPPTEVIDIISMVLDNSFSIPFKSCIVTLISRDSNDLTKDNSMDRLEIYLRQMKLSGGQSLCFSYIGDMKKYFRQSKKALELSLHLNDQKVICKYEDYAFHHLAQICSKMTNIKEMCHPCVLSIQDYDEQNGTNLLESLYFYLKYEKSIHSAAQAMHVHRNTLYNRICKIKSIIEIDWDNHNVVKYICMSIRILEYVEEFSFETKDYLENRDG